MFKKYLTLSLIISALAIFSFTVYTQSANRDRVAGLSTFSGQGNIKGTILPHHDLAKDYINSSLDRISQNHSFSNIVIIGPNHFETGSKRFVSTDELLNYPISQEYVYRLESLKLVTLNKETIEKEHSIMIPLSYLQNYFPNANYIFIASPFFFDTAEISRIATILSTSLPDDTLFIASVDFAHNKMLLEAMENNKEAETAIINFDYDRIYRYQDDHLDSPASIGLFLNIMQRLDATNWELWYESHGALIEGKYDLQGTSYLIGVFKNR
jgi:AmmeMemoRadiSam system protein B